MKNEVGKNGKWCGEEYVCEKLKNEMKNFKDRLNTKKSMQTSNRMMTMILN